jgi:hypothetical protein
MGKVGGCRFRVQACPGAIGCGYEIIFIFYVLGYQSPHLVRPDLGQGSKVMAN